MKLSNKIKYIIGIDEAGRGPLAGPVSVGVCLVPIEMTRKNLLSRFSKSGISELKKIKDSKKLSEKQREAWFAEMLKMKDVNFSATLISNKIIDDKGISFAIRQAMNKSLDKIINSESKIDPDECRVLLDGGLHAPAEFVNQKTIIKGDEKEFSISLASIAAKVTRDNYMKKIAKKYPLYSFEVHKGYGTERHIKAIKKEGISELHRVSFLKNIVKS